MSLMDQFRTKYGNKLWEEFLEDYSKYPLPDYVTKELVLPINFNVHKELTDVLIIKDPLDTDISAMDTKNKENLYINFAKLLKDNDLDLHNTTWINCIPYMPFVKVGDEIQKRPPNTKEQIIAKQYLNKLINIMNPKVIILLGNVSFRMFRTDSNILEEHGKQFNILNHTFFPLYSLKYIVNLSGSKKEDAKKELVADVNTLVEYLKKEGIINNG